MPPNEWTRCPVQEMGDVHAGRQRSPGFIEGKLRPYLRVANVFDGWIDFKDVNSMPFTEEEFERYKLTPGDVLLNEGQSLELVGRPALFMGPTNTYCFQNTLVRFTPSPKVLPEFAELKFQQCLYDGTFQGIAKKTTSIAHLGVSRFAALELDWPPLDEQRAIARVLEAWDAAIATTEKLLANSRRQKDALISELLMPVPAAGRGRSVGDAFPASVQPGIPQLPPTPPGWQRTSLGQLLKEAPRPVSLYPDDVYKLVTVRRSRGGVGEREVLTGKQIKTPSQFRIREGDFLISKRQIVHGACGVVPAHLDGAIVSNEYAVLNTTDGLDKGFLAYLAETTYFQQTCFHSSIGVHIEKMIFKLDRWLAWPFNIPPLDVQLQMVEQLDLACDQIRSIEHQLELLKQEKRALMADLLTGKRRVRVPALIAQPEAA